MTPPILFPSVGASGSYHHSSPPPALSPRRGMCLAERGSVTRSRFLAQIRSEKGRRIWNSHVAAGHRPNATNFHSILDGEGTEKRRLNPKGIVSFSPGLASLRATLGKAIQCGDQL